MPVQFWSVTNTTKRRGLRMAAHPIVAAKRRRVIDAL